MSALLIATCILGWIIGLAWVRRNYAIKIRCNGMKAEDYTLFMAGFILGPIWVYPMMMLECLQFVKDVCLKFAVKPMAKTLWAILCFKI